jgi:AcrR family transcriptional regulator
MARLTRRAVLDTALRLVDERGLDALSMRKLAAELGVEAMSLYNHVTNKADLLDGITARVFEDIPLPDPDLPSRQRLRALALAAHAALATHPVVARALAADLANPRSVDALRFIDALLGALLESGMDERQAARRYRSLFGLILGSVLTGAAAAPGTSTPEGEPIADWFTRTVTADRLPSLHRTLPALLDTDCIPAFSEELDHFLAAIPPTRRRTRSSSDRRGH